MSMEHAMGGVRLRWTALGVLLGVVGVSAVSWMRGGAGPEIATMEMTEPAMGGMDMQAQTSGPGDVRLSPAQLRRFGVTFAVVEEHGLESRVRTVGVVDVDETRLVEVVTKFPGYVDRLYADFTGKVVHRGDALLDVYAPDLVAAQEEILLARALRSGLGVASIPGLTTPPVDLEATARRRLTLWDISDEQIDAMLLDGEPSRTLSLMSPITGTVLEKSVVAGGAFRAGETLFRLADLSTVWVTVEIRESEAARVTPGSPAVATLTSYPGERFVGVVDFIYPTVEEQTRSVRARVVLPNTSGRLRPGMFATVVVTTPHGSALSVPSDAVVWTGDGSLLFVADEGGGVRPVEVELGATVGDRTVILTGVAEGERVVSAAQYLIDAEANIGAIMRSMMSMMGSGDMGGMDMGGMDMDGMDMEGMDMPVDTLTTGR